MIKKLAGRWKAGECTLTRGLTNDQSFDKWIHDSQLGNMGNARKNGAITVYDRRRERDQALQPHQRLAEKP